MFVVRRRAEEQRLHSGVPGPVSNLRAEYYYYYYRKGSFPKECFRAALRISWSAPRVG